MAADGVKGLVPALSALTVRSSAGPGRNPAWCPVATRSGAHALPQLQRRQHALRRRRRELSWGATRVHTSLSQHQSRCRRRAAARRKAAHPKALSRSFLRPSDCDTHLSAAARTRDVGNSVRHSEDSAMHAAVTKPGSKTQSESGLHLEAMLAALLASPAWYTEAYSLPTILTICAVKAAIVQCDKTIENSDNLRTQQNPMICLGSSRLPR